MKQEKKWNLEPNGAEAALAIDWSGRWLVLRCANQKTLPLVVAMTRLGLKAWTPMWVRKRRYPRSHNFREVLLPCLPSFVFLAEDDGERALVATEARGIPGFTFMNSYGVLVRIRDEALESLRKFADLNPRKVNPMPWPALGSHQKIISGAFQGLICKVVGRTHRHCLVDLDGSNHNMIKIPPFLLADLEA